MSSDSLIRRSDEELMLAYQQDDSTAFNELYDRFSKHIYGYLKRRIQDPILVDDIFQATFFKIHQTRSRYRAPLPVLPWFFTICRSVMIDALRAKERKYEQVEDLASSKLIAPNESPSMALAIEPGKVDGVLGVTRLTTQQRKALELRFGKDLSFEEISIQLNTSPLNVRQLVSRGLRKLKVSKKYGRSNK